MKRAVKTKEGNLLLVTIEEAVDGNYPVIYNSKTTEELIKKGALC